MQLTVFADKMTCFLRDIASFHWLLATLQPFCTFSNLPVNDNKMENFTISRHHLDSTKYSHEIVKLKETYRKLKGLGRISIKLQLVVS